MLFKLHLILICQYFTDFGSLQTTKIYEQIYMLFLDFAKEKMIKALQLPRSKL